MKKKKIRIRCWIDIDGNKFFGPGPAELLEHIQAEGSIAKAAKEMGMSYKKAWDIIENLNLQANKPLVIPRKGGKRGGGAEVTDTGKQIVSRYHSLTQKLNAIIEKDKELLRLI